MQEELANLFPGGTQIFRGTNTDIPLVTGNAVWKNGEWIRVGIAVANTTNISTVNSPNPNIIYGWRMEKTGTAADSGVRQNTIPLVIGQEYTLSCYARGITEGAHFKFQYGVSGNWRNQGQNITGNWERYSVTFVPTTANTDIIIGLNTTYTGIVEICGAKLESGNKATDWSQSPWDIENAIKSVAVSPSTTAPRVAGTASAGNEMGYSRGDHVHQAQTTVQRLVTARTINGTNFDGTANITTANWGTARNITVASSDETGAGATTSVNGSGNIVLRMPGTIKANLTGNADSATRLATSSMAQKIDNAFTLASRFTRLALHVSLTARTVHFNTTIESTTGGTLSNILVFNITNDAYLPETDMNLIGINQNTGASYILTVDVAQKRIRFISGGANTTYSANQRISVFGSWITR